MSLIISPTLNSKILILSRKKQGLPVYNFGLGENMLPQPKELIEAIHKYSDKKQYIPVSGIPELNQQIKNQYSNNNYHIDNIIFGNGLKELLFLVQMAFDGTIIHLHPSWVSYKEQTKLLNKKTINFNTKFDDNYKILPKDLNKLKRLFLKKLVDESRQLYPSLNY